MSTIHELTDAQAKEICRIGKGPECCPFLVMGSKGFECVKENISVGDLIRGRIKAGTMNAKGEPCDLSWIAKELKEKT